MSFHHIAAGVVEVLPHSGPVVCNLAEWFRIPDRGYRPSAHRERKARQQERLKAAPRRARK